MMILYIFPRYGCLGASSRYRVFQYLNSFKNAGIKIYIYPLFSNSYLKSRYNYSKFPIRKVVKSYLERILYLKKLQKGKVLYIEKELFPWLPFSFEQYFLKDKKYILDYDDAIYVWYRKFPILENKIKHLAENAHAVLVGNKWLFDYFCKINKNTFYIPTAIDISKYKPKKNQKINNPVRIGWIGTPLSQVHLDDNIQIFRRIYMPKFELWLMGTNKSYNLEDKGIVKCFKWSLRREKEFLQAIDIGIMPLAKGEFSEGKCGFKLLQYMASKVPCIASYSQANSDILEHGKAGLIANNEQDWIKAINELCLNEELRINLTEKAFERVCNFYSKQKWSDTLLGILLKILNY